MRITACVAALCLGLAGLAGAATCTPSSVASAAIGENACAFSKSGRRLGCLSNASACLNLTYWTEGRWIYAHEGHGPEPHVGAKRLSAGVWRVVDWPERTELGLVVAANAKYTRWNIKNKRGALVATARGRDGPLMGLVLLLWGRSAFC